MTIIDEYKAALLDDPIRILHQAFAELKENYTDDTAILFKMKYDRLSLRDIMESSEYIFKEHIYGLPFFMDQFKKELPYYEYSRQLKRMEQYISSIIDIVDDTVIEKFMNAYDMLNDLNNLYKHSGFVADTYRNVNNNEDAIYTLYDAINDYKENSTKEKAVTIQKCVSPFYHDYVEQVLYVIPALSLIDKRVELYTLVQDIASLKDKDNMEHITDYMTISFMMEDAGMVHLNKLLCNQEAGKILHNMRKESFIDIYKPDIESDIATVMDTWESVIQEEDWFEGYVDRSLTFSSMTEDTLELEHEENKQKLEEDRIICLESCINVMERIIGVSDDIIINDSNIFKDMFEDTDLRHAYDMFMEASVYAKRNAVTDHANNIKPSTAVSDKVVPQELQTKKDYKKNLKSIHKPKPSVNSKIQSKMLDVSRGAQNITAKTKRGLQTTANTVKSVAEIPQSAIDAVQSAVKEAKDMSFEKRKRALLTEKDKSKFMSSLTNAVSYGISGAVHPLMVPIKMFYRKFQKERDKRIRFHIQSDLKTEIKIWNDNYDHYKSSGQVEKSNDALRVINELEKELVAFQTHGKVA